MSVIVLNYNGLRWLEPCLRATFGQLMTSRSEMIVVDNASNDGSVEFIRARFSGPDLVLDEKTGFAAGNNVGARVSRGRYLAFLNNDCVPQPGWLRP